MFSRGCIRTSTDSRQLSGASWITSLSGDTVYSPALSGRSSKATEISSMSCPSRTMLRTAAAGPAPAPPIPPHRKAISAITRVHSSSISMRNEALSTSQG